MSILNVYAVALGQAVNFQKSEVYFSHNTPEQVQMELAGLLGVQARLGEGKYLGLPSINGRNRTATFKYIKERVWKKLNSLSGRFLSIAGKEVLVKAVLQAIPSYCMSAYLLPKSLCKDIERMVNSY